MSGPLSGVRVLDLSRILAGPWATQVLADYGADVIKIERPQSGDDTRHWGPPYFNPGSDYQQSAYFLAANRGKQSVAIDFTTQEGQSVIKQLLAGCDVLVENYKVDGLKKYGLDYQSLKADFPELIYCSITGFGQTGPYKERAGYDAIIQGMGGLMSITGERDDLPGGGPQKVGVAVADLMTGMYAVSAIMAAIIHRMKHREGQHIDLALLDTQVAWLANQNMNYLVGKQIPERQGTSHPNIVPYQAVKCLNGHFMLAVGNDSQFARFCEVLGRNDLSSDPRFSTNAARVNFRNELIPEIEFELNKKDSDYWLKALNAQKIPCAPINNLEQVFADPQVRSRNMAFSISHNLMGEVTQVANPVKFSQTTIEYKNAPPLLGEHTGQVLKDVGYTPSQLSRLFEQGVIA